MKYICIKNFQKIKKGDIVNFIFEEMSIAGENINYYNVTDINDKYVCLIADNLTLLRFKSLDEYREETINKIL